MIITSDSSISSDHLERFSWRAFPTISTLVMDIAKRSHFVNILYKMTFDPRRGSLGILFKWFSTINASVEYGEESPSSNSLLSMFLVMLVIFQVSSMAISQNLLRNLAKTLPSTDDDGQQMSDFSLEFGYDLAGEQLNIENIVNGMVRYETDLDIYHNEIIQSPL